jgi:hypothetical protein
MTIPNFSDFGLTSALWAPDDTTVTVDAQMRASAFEDSLGLIADYTQGTNVNKPLYSREDNKGNISTSNNDLTTAFWTKGLVTAPSANVVRADAGGGNHFINNNSNTFRGSQCINGASYRVFVKLKYINHLYAWVGDSGGSSFHGSRIKLDTKDVQTQTNCTCVYLYTDDEGYDIYEYNYTASGAGVARQFQWYVTFGVSTITTGTGNYTAAGTEEIGVGGVYIQDPVWDRDLIDTTDHPQYAGVNGQKWLVCNGAQALVNTDVTSDIFAAGTKLAYIPIQSFLLNASQNIFRDTAGNFFTLVASSGSNFSFSNNDGSTDVVTASATLVTSILRFRQTGGNIYLAVDSGAGYVESAPVASGDTADLSSTIQIGRTANGFYGKIGGVLTANTGVPKPNLEALLRESVFARSLFRYDPYIGDLVIKRQ